jgi:hypothetical protein
MECNTKKIDSYLVSLSGSPLTANKTSVSTSERRASIGYQISRSGSTSERRASIGSSSSRTNSRSTKSYQISLSGSPLTASKTSVSTSKPRGRSIGSSSSRSNNRSTKSYQISLSASPLTASKKSVSTGKPRGSIGSTSSHSSKGKKRSQKRRSLLSNEPCSYLSHESYHRSKNRSRKSPKRIEEDTSDCSVISDRSSKIKSKRRSRRSQKEKNLDSMLDQLEDHTNSIATENDSLKKELCVLEMEKEYTEQLNNDLESKLEEMQAQLDMKSLIQVQGPSPSLPQMEDPDSMGALRIENEILRNRLKRHEFSLLKVASGKSLSNLGFDQNAQNTNHSAVVLEKEKAITRLHTELSLLRTNLRDKSAEFNEMKEELAKAKDVLQHTGSIKYHNFNRMSCPAPAAPGDAAFSNFFNAL